MHQAEGSERSQWSGAAVFNGGIATQRSDKDQAVLPRFRGQGAVFSPMCCRTEQVGKTLMENCLRSPHFNHPADYHVAFSVQRIFINSASLVGNTYLPSIHFGLFQIQSQLLCRHEKTQLPETRVMLIFDERLDSSHDAVGIQKTCG